MDPYMTLNTSVASTSSSRLSGSSSVSFADDWDFTKFSAGYGYEPLNVWQTPPSDIPSPEKKRKGQGMIQKFRPEYFDQYKGLEEAPPPEEVLSPVPEAAPLAAKTAKFELYLDTLPSDQKEVAMEIAENFKANPSVFVLPSSSLLSSMVPLPNCFESPESTDSFTFDPSASKLSAFLADTTPTVSNFLILSDWPSASSIGSSKRLQKKRSFEEVLVGLQEGDGATRCFGHIVADTLMDKPQEERVALAQEIWMILTTPKRAKLSAD